MTKLFYDLLVGITVTVAGTLLYDYIKSKLNKQSLHFSSSYSSFINYIIERICFSSTSQKIVLVSAGEINFAIVIKSFKVTVLHSKLRTWSFYSFETFKLVFKPSS